MALLVGQVAQPVGGVQPHEAGVGDLDGRVQAGHRVQHLLRRIGLGARRQVAAHAVGELGLHPHHLEEAGGEGAVVEAQRAGQDRRGEGRGLGVGGTDLPGGDAALLRRQRRRHRVLDGIGLGLVLRPGAVGQDGDPVAAAAGLEQRLGGGARICHETRFRQSGRPHGDRPGDGAGVVRNRTGDAPQCECRGIPLVWTTS